MTWLTKLKGYRTLATSGLVAGLGAAHTLLPTIKEAIKPEYFGPLLLVIGVIYAVLRTITSTPVGKANPPAEEAVVPFPSRQPDEGANYARPD